MSTPDAASLMGFKEVSNGNGNGKAPDHTEEAANNQVFLELPPAMINIAKSKLSVLVTGETGVGKEVMARTIHAYSERPGIFVGLNCGAIPEEIAESELFGHVRGAFTGAVAARKGFFEMARGGTLLLDEITEMPLSLQVKLLRVLQNKEISPVGGDKTCPIDVRIIATTNRDIEQAIEQKRFRKDLWYRIAGATFAIPPLRERIDEIPALAEVFIQKYSAEEGRDLQGIADEAIALLKRHDWPGNVRELEHTIHRAVVCASGKDMIAAADISLRPLTFGSFSMAASPHAAFSSKAEEPITETAAKETPGEDASATSDASDAGLSVEQSYKTLLEEIGNYKKIVDLIYEIAVKKTHYNQSQAARVLGLEASSVYGHFRGKGNADILDAYAAEKGSADKLIEAGFTILDAGHKLSEIKQNLYEHAVTINNGNKSAAARVLGVSATAVLYRVKKPEDVGAPEAGSPGLD